MPDHDEDPHQSRRSARKRIKEVTIRFNKEAAPFQHVRIEATATITRDDDAETVRNALRDFCEETFWDIQERMFSDHTKQIALEVAANKVQNAQNTNENPY